MNQPHFYFSHSWFFLKIEAINFLGKGYENEYFVFNLRNYQKFFSND